MSTSFSLAQFCVARLVLGFGTGGIIATVSVWQSELSRPQNRGGHVSGFGIFCGSGLSLALWVDFGMSHTTGSVQWRFSLAFVGIFAIIVMVTIFLVPGKCSCTPSTSYPHGVNMLVLHQQNLLVGLSRRTESSRRERSSVASTTPPSMTTSLTERSMMSKPLLNCPARRTSLRSLPWDTVASSTESSSPSVRRCFYSSVGSMPSLTTLHP
jgi:MFS family permease